MKTGMSTPNSKLDEKVSLTIVISKDALDKMGGQLRLAEGLKQLTSDENLKVLGERRRVGWGSSGPMC